MRSAPGGPRMSDPVADVVSIATTTKSGQQRPCPPCAIVGMALRLPGSCNSPRAFWDFLQGDAYPVASLAERRFKWPGFIDPHGAHLGIDRAFLIDHVASQDMAFFGISPKEAELMDPQQRILLELGWEALESAGIRPSSLSGTTTGVFIGASHADYREIAGREALTPEAYVGTGTSPCILSNRLSYFFNLKGPSYTVDAACSTSLFALAEGVKAIERGECEQALVGAINLILTPTGSIAYYQSGMLSSTASCNPFDDGSDGYIRAEGAGMLVLKSLDKARRDGDRVLGIVRAAAVNHGGKARSLTAPSALSQAQVVGSAFEQAGLRVDCVNYIETHGTGTPVGDPIEIHGLTRGLARLAKRQGVELPAGHVALGALKARLGHAEPAAGIGAIAKVLLAMQHRRLPSNPRLRTINRRIDLDDTPLRLLREEQPWVSPVGDPQTGPLFAGISSFGFGGTNAHIVLESGDPLPSLAEGEGGPWPFGLSARSDERLAAYARTYLDWLAGMDVRELRLCDLSRTMLVGRERMECRAAFAAASIEELCAALTALAEAREAPGLYRATSAGDDVHGDADDAQGLALRWLRGEDPDFGALHARSRPLLHAPTYPFDRKPFWLPWRSHDDTTPVVLAETRSNVPGSAGTGVEAVATPDAASKSMDAPWEYDALRAALIGMVAELCRRPAEEIDPSLAFADYGLDSILAVGLTRQINACWGTRISPATIFDHRNIDLLARHIAGQAPAGVAESGATPAGADGLAGSDELLSTLVDFVAELIKADPAALDPDARFVDYGVDSIVIVGLTRRINAEWGQQLKPTTLFDLRTLRNLATHLEGDIARARIRSGSPAIPRSGMAPGADAPPPASRSAAQAVPSSTRRSHHAVVLREPAQPADVFPDDVADPVSGEEDVVVAVRAFSLNFGDLLCVKGFYPDMPEYPFTPGFEASGVVVAVGSAVRGIAIGDAVVTLSGHSLGAHATRVQSHASRVFPIPQGLDFVEACALPVVAMTVLDAFAKARPQPGEAILIHSAAGGVGLAALQLARHSGLEIHATVGSEAKREYLHALGVSRTIVYPGQDFEREVMAMTAGRGVDIVLNTLAGDALQKGLNLLAPGGRYVEIAMAALKSATSIDLSALSDNQSFFAVNLRKLGLKHPERMRELYARMSTLVGQGVFRAVVGRTYPFDHYPEALAHLASRESIGKIVVTIPEAMRYDAGAEPLAAPIRAAPAPALRETDIAVIGMSGRFPGSEDLDALWAHLAQGDDLVGPVTRWDLSAHHHDGRRYCDSGSFLDRIDAFDPLFFGIAGIEARYMDPQQRLLLEEAWHALEHAGYASERANDGVCGTFIGCAEGDYHRLFGAEGVPAQAFWGNAASLTPARIAYHLDLRGPAVAIDTACSSSLVAVHQACQALWLGEVDMALAGGVFVQSTPRLYLSAERADMLSHRGHCHSFGESADGFVPGEGVGVIVLKRLSRALADGDHVHAVIRGSGIGQDGTTNGITAPNGQAQQRLECGIYRKFGIDPARIRMVEAHGTGTSLGDPIEFDALTRSFGEFTDRRGFCALGSIKSNLGHLAPAAGIAGLLKVLLALRHAMIPPTLHSRPHNPYLDLERSAFYLSERLHPWPESPGGVRMAAVSSFGFSGTNAHVVVEAATQSVPASPPQPAYLVMLSAHSREQLIELAARLLRQLRAEPMDCGHLSHTLLLGRKHLGHRIACVVRDATDLAERLDAWLAGRSPDAIASAEVAARGASGLAAMVEAGEDCLARCARSTDPRRYADDLRTLAQLYLQGYTFDYRPLFAAGGFRRVPLPVYPFARNRYWVGDADAGPADVPTALAATAPLHPLVHENRSANGRQRYRSLFAGDEAFFADHRVHGQPLMSGAAQLEMAVAAAAVALDAPAEAIALEDVLWLRPLIASGRTEVRIELAADGVNALRFEILGAPQDPQMVYCSGRARRVDAAIENAMEGSAAADLDDSDVRCFDADVCYAAYRLRGIEYGPSHRGLIDVRVGAQTDRVLARVMLPETEAAANFHWSPQLLDSAFQAAIGFDLTESGDGEKAPLVPYALARFVRHRAPTAAMRVLIRRRRDGEGTVFDVDLHDEAGRLCLHVEGLQARPLIARSPAARALAEMLPRPDEVLLLLPQWRAEEPVPLAAVALGNVPIVGLDGATVARWRDALPGCMDVGIHADDTAEAVREKLAAQGRFDRLLIVFAHAEPDPEPGEALLVRHDRAVRLLWRIIKALLALGHDARDIDLTIITRRAQALDAVDAVDPALASIHGIVGTLAKEFPQWALRLLDLDALPELSPQALLSIPGDVMGNAWMTRAGRWYRQQLVPCRVPESKTPVYRDGGVYVILGGAGGIGEVYSEYLIRRHRARIVWLGRRVEDAAIRARLDRLSALGERPRYFAVDATDREALSQVRTRIVDAFGAIHGVVHSALVLKDASLAQMGEETLFHALDAKSRTSVRLAVVFAADPLDFMLFFSSANSFLRAPGQANYVAGCLFEDAFAQTLARTLPYPVKVVNWGYWGSVGVVADAAIAQRVAAFGLSSIDPARALPALADLLAAPGGQFAYLAVHRPLAALGVPIAADLRCEVMPSAAGTLSTDPLSVLMRAFDESVPVVLDDSRARIETAALPWLWHQILASGAVIAEPGSLATYRIAGERGRHARWLDESLRRLVAAGAISIVGGDDGGRIAETIAAHIAEDAATASARWSALVADAESSDSRHWLPTLDAALRALPDILSDRRLATEVLFPDSSMALVEAIYKGDRLACACNDALGALVAAHARNVGGDAMRVLEIGAGTGASSERILARLKAAGLRPAEYVYTDVSKAFLLHAETRYGPDADFLRYDLLDIERPLPVDSAHVGRYDLVVAANVLHATVDIRTTLENAKTMLRRGGLLLINEIAENSLMMHLTFGLLDGWWLHRDAGLRMPGGPALSPESWRRALAACGFARAIWPLPSLHALGSQLIVAQSDGAVLRPVAWPAGEGQGTMPPPPADPALPSAGGGDVDADAKTRAAQWVAGGKTEAVRLLALYLRDMAGEILGLRQQELDTPSSPFSEAMLGGLGMDSLLASNFRNRLLKEIEIDIPVQVLIGDRVADIVDQMYQQLLLRQVAAAPGGRETDRDFETLVF